MTPQEYYQLIKLFQEEEFSGELSGDYAVSNNKYTKYAPSYYFRPSDPLMTQEIVNDLKDKNKKLLSVGCGPAYLERLLVSRLGIKNENVVLADISEEDIPKGFIFHQFDMHQEWPKLNETLDYIIFPESALLSLNFPHKFDKSSGDLRQPKMEEALYNLLTRALNILNSNGQVRLTSLDSYFIRDAVKARLESKSSNLEMGYIGEVIYVLKR